MAEEVIRRQGSATDHGSFTGAAGEITVENTNWNLRIHDGATAGGHTTLMDSDLANGSGSGVTQADQSEDITQRWVWRGDTGIRMEGTGASMSIVRRVTNNSNTITDVWEDSNSNGIARLHQRDMDGTGAGGLRLDEADYLEFAGVAVFDGTAAGGSQGANTANFTEIYENGNRVLTDYVFDAYLDGQIDYDHYDALMGTRMVESETETEEVEEDEEVTEPVTTVREEWDEKQQAYIRREITEQRPVYDEYPVKDEQGNEVGVRRVQRTQKVKKQVPKQVEVRDEHAPAKRYEFDDLDCDAFWAKCAQSRKLPAFKRCEDNLREGQQRPSMGQVAQALTETVEDMAVHIHELNERLKKLER